MDIKKNSSNGKRFIYEADSLKDNPAQGVIKYLVQKIDTGNIFYTKNYLTPTKHGIIEITDYDANYLYIKAKDGYKYKFSLDFLGKFYDMNYRQAAFIDYKQLDLKYIDKNINIIKCWQSEFSPDSNIRYIIETGSLKNDNNQGAVTLFQINAKNGNVINKNTWLTTLKKGPLNIELEFGK